MNAPGIYSGTKAKCVTSESPTKKTPCLAISFDITHIAQGGDWVALDQPVQRTVFLYLSDGAWPYTQEKLVNMGFNGDFANPDVTNDPVQLECRHETYEGKAQEKWDIAGGGSFEAQPTSADVMRKFTAKWKMENKPKTPVPAGKPSNPPPKLPASDTNKTAPLEPINTGDVPFDPASVPY